MTVYSRCDKDYESHFLTVLLPCLVAYRITMENDYVSALLSVDGLRHPLLRGLPVTRRSEQEEFHMTRADFIDKRINFITGKYHMPDSDAGFFRLRCMG